MKVAAATAPASAVAVAVAAAAAAPAPAAAVIVALEDLNMELDASINILSLLASHEEFKQNPVVCLLPLDDWILVWLHIRNCVAVLLGRLLSIFASH